MLTREESTNSAICLLNETPATENSIVSWGNQDTDYQTVINFIILGGFVFGMIYGLYNKFNKKQETEVGTLDTLPSIKNAASEANSIYKKETRLPYTQSKLVGQFGFLSMFRHDTAAGDDFNKAIINFNTENPAKQYVIRYLQTYGSLWDAQKGFNHSFANYFLTCLRHENIDAYRDIVGKAYGVKFISGEILLYRRDTRLHNVIFREGFELKESYNTYDTRKSNYAETVTMSYGVSLSKKIPPKGYGDPNGYYIIKLGEKHNFLLIDIVESPRNKHKLTPERINLQEVNSLDNIPPEAIAAHIDTSKRFFFFVPMSIKTENKRFAENIIHDPKRHKKMGCY